jgi:hypothetical protein
MEIASPGLPAGSARPGLTRLDGGPRTASTRLPLQTVTNGLWLSLVAGAAITAWILVDLDGWRYYTTPLGVRGYLPMHKVLRPTGRVAHLLGVAGGLMMLVPVAYALRKRVRALSRLGSMHAWLEVHIFCGLVGPLLVTFHTSFKFNGVVSVAYWMMVVVALSGVVGRYLYVRIPRTVRGLELTRDDIVRRAAALRADLEALALPAPIRAEVAAVERAFDTGAVGPAAAMWLAWRARWRTRRALDAERAAFLRDALALVRERVVLERRLAVLDRTRRLFALWHVLHVPLVWLMFAIAALHVGITLYLGYWPSLR